MTHVDFNCLCGLQLILTFNGHEYEYKCPGCGLKITRWFNPKTDKYEFLFDKLKDIIN